MKAHLKGVFWFYWIILFGPNKKNNIFSPILLVFTLPFSQCKTRTQAQINPKLFSRTELAKVLVQFNGRIINPFEKLVFLLKK